MAHSTRASGIRKQNNDTEGVIRSGPTAAYMKDTGNMTKQTAAADLSTRMVTFTMATGRMIRLMGLVSILIQMALSMRATGSTTNNMEKARNTGLTARNMKDSTNTERKMVTANFSGPTVQAIVVISSIIIFMVRVLTRGPMAVYTTATGKITKCMARACSHGQMGENTRANIMTTKSRVMAFFIGPTVVSIMDSGWQASSKVLAFTSTLKGRCGMGVGKMESVLNGSQKTSTTWKFNATRTNEIDRRACDHECIAFN